MLNFSLYSVQCYPLLTVAFLFLNILALTLIIMCSALAFLTSLSGQTRAHSSLTFRAYISLKQFQLIINGPYFAQRLHVI